MLAELKIFQYFALFDNKIGFYSKTLTGWKVTFWTEGDVENVLSRNIDNILNISVDFLSL